MKDRVKRQIEFLKGRRIVIPKQNQSFIDELKSYKFHPKLEVLYGLCDWNNHIMDEVGL